MARVQIEDSSLALENIAIVAQGIKTGANDFFIFDIVSDDGARCEVVNGLGQRALLERELLRPVIYGSELQRYSEVLPERRIFYPYRGGAVIPEAIMEKSFPMAWGYLVSNRDILGSRSSLLQSKGKFYELVRPRDELWLQAPKLMSKDLATRTSFAVDAIGATFLVGGTAVVPNDSDNLYMLLAYLNSGFINSYVNQTTPIFQGGYQKFEPKHLQSIPVIEPLLYDQELQRSLSNLGMSLVNSNDADEKLALELAIDDLIRNTEFQGGN